MMQGPKEKINEFGGKLGYKFCLLQEWCPDHYNTEQLRVSEKAGIRGTY